MDKEKRLEEGDMCPACKCCGLMWMECESCGGEGQTEPGELFESDPFWYDEDDTEPCGICKGACGWLVCIGACDHNGCHEKTSKAGEALRADALAALDKLGL